MIETAVRRILQANGIQRDQVPLNTIIDGSQHEGYSVTIPEGVTEIGSWVFRDCHRLTFITIPEGVTKIHPEAFCKISNEVTVITDKEDVWKNKFPLEATFISYEDYNADSKRLLASAMKNAVESRNLQKLDASRDILPLIERSAGLDEGNAHGDFIFQSPRENSNRGDSCSRVIL